MSGERMLAFLANCSMEQQLQLRIVTQCAPVLKGIKLSNLISVKPGQWHQVKKYLRETKVVCSLLYADKDKEVLLLYRFGMLEQHLKKPEVRRFLEAEGYLDLSIPAVFLRLRRRYQRYAGGVAEFPHELGIILEYPVEDVKSFIRHKGQNCLMERYWKVYHDLDEAKRTFLMYDKAREDAMDQILAGYQLLQVAIS